MPAPNRPARTRKATGCRRPSGTFSLSIRAYWADKVILDGTWLPPIIAMVE